METLLVGGADSNSLVELRLISYHFKRNWKIRIRHVLRSQNMVANQMTKLACSSESKLLLFMDPPSSIQELLQAYKNANTSIVNVNT